MTKRAIKHVYRCDDRVIIVEPLVVRRVGYPLGIADGLKHVESHSADVVGLLIKLGIKADGRFGPEQMLSVPITDNGVDRALAYSWLKTQRFGGPQRSIHTTVNEALRGAECRVVDKRVVYTGVRVNGSGGWSYDGDYDAEPPHLSQTKAHVLLRLWPIEPTDTFRSSGEEIEVEECHVKPVAPITQETSPWL